MELDFFDYLNLFSIVGLAAMSPGPDFIVFLRQARKYGEVASRWTACGFTVGVTIHVCLILFFFNQIDTRLLQMLRVFGGVYLFYLGLKALRHWFEQGRQLRLGQISFADPAPLTKIAGRRYQFFLTGLFTNLLNPKALIFLSGLLLSSAYPHAHKGTIVFCCVLPVFLWFMSLGIILNKKNLALKINPILDRSEVFLGIILIAFGSKMVFG